MDLPQLWNFADLRLRTQSFCDFTGFNLWIYDLGTQAFLADLKLSQFCKYILFLLTNVAYPRFIKLTFRAVFRLSCAVFCRNLWICDLWVNQENLRICDLRTGTPIRNLRISDGGMSQRKCRFAICGLIQKSLLVHLWNRAH